MSMVPIPQKVKDKVIKAVEDGASLRDLAIWCDVSYQTIWHIVKGIQREARPETIDRISRGIEGMNIATRLWAQILHDTIHGKDLSTYKTLIREEDNEN